MNVKTKIYLSVLSQISLLAELFTVKVPQRQTHFNIASPNPDINFVICNLHEKLKQFKLELEF